MEPIEIALWGLTAVACTGVCALAYYYAAIRAAYIKDQGIDRRRAYDQANPSAATYTGRQEWWQPILLELAKNPQVAQLLVDKAPQLIERFAPKQR